MAACSHFSLFFAIAALCMITCTPVAVVYGDQPTVHVLNNMPKKEPAEQLNIECRIRGLYTLGPHVINDGDEYQWNVTKGHEIYHCVALWFNRLAAFHAYQPRRDANLPAVFWSVKDDGFYYSLDKSSWKRMAIWESE